MFILSPQKHQGTPLLSSITIVTLLPWKRHFRLFCEGTSRLRGSSKGKEIPLRNSYGVFIMYRTLREREKETASEATSQHYYSTPFSQFNKGDESSFVSSYGSFCCPETIRFFDKFRCCFWIISSSGSFSEFSS
jgi:hypothetical protein